MEGLASCKVDTLATTDMWPDLFQGQSFPSASHVVVIGGAKEYQLWNLRWEGRQSRSRSSRSRRAKSSHESHDDVTRSAHARVGLFMCGFPTKRKWERGRDGRKEGKNYSYNSLITRRGRDNLICKNSTAAGMDASHFMIRRIPLLSGHLVHS